MSRSLLPSELRNHVALPAFQLSEHCTWYSELLLMGTAYGKEGNPSLPSQGSGGTGRTRTDTRAYTREWISNPLQYLLCLLFHVVGFLTEKPETVFHLAVGHSEIGFALKADIFIEYLFFESADTPLHFCKATIITLIALSLATFLCQLAVYTFLCVPDCLVESFSADNHSFYLHFFVAHPTGFPDPWGTSRYLPSRQIRKREKENGSRSTRVAPLTGFEPVPYGLTVRRSTI